LTSLKIPPEGEGEADGVFPDPSSTGGLIEGVVGGALSDAALKGDLAKP